MLKPISKVWQIVLEKFLIKYPKHSRSLEVNRGYKTRNRLRRNKQKRWQKIKETIEKYDV